MSSPNPTFFPKSRAPGLLAAIGVWTALIGATLPAHAALGRLLDKLACGTLLAPELTAEQQVRLERWLTAEVGPSLGEAPEIKTQTAREVDLFMLKVRMESARDRRFVYRAMANPAIEKHQLNDYFNPDWQGFVGRAEPWNTTHSILLTIHGRDFTWRPGREAPVTGDFVIGMEEYELYGQNGLALRPKDQVPDLIECARRNAGINENAHWVTLVENHRWGRTTYIRLDANGTPAQKLKAALTLLHALELEIERAPTTAQVEH